MGIEYLFTCNDIILLLFIGGLIGGFVSRLIYDRKTSYGALEINYSDPERDVYRIKLDVSLEELAKKKRVVLLVENQDKRSQE